MGEEFFKQFFSQNSYKDTYRGETLSMQICNHCVKCFLQNLHLKRRIRTYTGEKLYECNQYTKCFIQNVNLKKHIKTHSGERPYKCNI